MEYADAVLEKYRLVFNTLQAGYDTMIETSLDAEMSGKTRREQIWASMKQSFLKTTADMLKQWIIDEARKIIEESFGTETEDAFTGIIKERKKEKAKDREKDDSGK